MADFDLKMDGLDVVADALNKLGWLVTPRGMSKVLGDLGLVLKRRASRAFREEQAPDETGDTESEGQQWEPLAESTQNSRLWRRSTAKKTYGHLVARRAKKKRGGAARSVRALRDSGTLARSITISKDIGRASITVGTPVEYGLYQHEGTDPYTIHASAGGTLAFIGSEGGVVFSKSVDHPGIPSRSFLGYDKADIEGMFEIIIRHLNKMPGGSGGTSSAL